MFDKDPVMKKLFEKFGEINVKQESDLYFDLVESIISQQLSVKAAATIFQRFKNLFHNGKIFPTPKEILKMPDEKLRSAGISYAKIKYIKSLSEFVESKKLVLTNLKNLSDEEVISELTKVKGIGRWTAEMILIFSLGRPDVFSMGDLGLKKAVAILYEIDIKDMKQIEAISLNWKPYRSLASRYLWKSLD